MLGTDSLRASRFAGYAAKNAANSGSNSGKADAGSHVRFKDAQTQALANANASAVVNCSLGVESSRPGFRSTEDLISPHWAGISTSWHMDQVAVAKGPVPSATLDKRWWLASEKMIANCETESRVERGRSEDEM